MTTSENASGLPIGQLGSTIKAHMGMAEKYIGKCEEHYRSAGQHLIEAKRRILENKEFAGDFKGFLMNCCNGLAEQRAYELIGVANGTQSVAAMRERSAESMRKSRADAAEREADGLRNVAESDDPQSNQQLGATESPESKRKRGGQPAPKTPEARLTALIAKACKTLDAEQLNTVLQFIRTGQVTASEKGAAAATKDILRKAAKFCREFSSGHLA